MRQKNTRRTYDIRMRSKALTSQQGKDSSYRYLDRLQEKVIYCDTYSVIYFQPRDDPETVHRLGHMTSELRDSVSVVEFLIRGPKNYEYSVLDTASGPVEKTVCKFRGITLNSSASQFINFEAVKDMTLGMGNLS